MSGDHRQASALRNATAEQAPGCGVILNVDDTPLTRRVVTGILERAGYAVHEADTGADALRLATTSPDLILLDVELPDIHGLEVARQLKEHAATARIPVLHLSATRVSDEDRVRGLDRGADGYLVHPVDPQVLLSTIRALLRIRSTTDRLHRLQLLMTALSSAETIEAVAEVVLREGRAAANAVEVALLRSVAHDASLEVLAASPGCAVGAGGRRLSVASSGPPGVCVWTGEPVWVGDRALLESDYPHAAAEWPSARALAWLPLRMEGRTWGTLGFSFHEPQTFADAERASLVTLAAQCELALARARLYEAERRARREAEAAVTRLEAVLLHLPAAIAIAEAPSGRIVLQNDHAPRAWPVRGEELPTDLRGHRPDGRPYADHEWPLTRALGGDVVTGEEIHLRRDDGTATIVRVNAAPVRDEDGAITGSVALAEDVTEEKRIAAALRESVRAREDMVAIVSHDLRDPLGVITMAAGMIRNGVASGAASAPIGRQAERILNASAQMNALMNALLDAASIEAGRFELDLAPTPVAPVLAESAEIFGPRAAERGIRLENGGDGGLVAVCDRQRVLQILSNLIGNAVKFTPRGGAIRVHAARDGERVRVIVSDSGIGISPDQIPHLFDRYWRGDRGKGAGTGLGLFIVKGIVEAHGGRIDVESFPGTGTAFSFTLPGT